MSNRTRLTRVAASSERLELATFYYHDHFMEMLGFVMKVYADFLNESERAFIARFLKLSMPAQCLFVRMVNRKSEIFSSANLNYAEIECIGDAIAELKANGFAKTVQIEDYLLCLLSLPKQELLDLAERQNIPDIRKSWCKAKLAGHVQSCVPFENIYGYDGNFIKAGCLEHVNYLLYLFFGKTRDNLTSFALRDLGLVRVKDEESFSSRFTDEDEARHSYFYLRLLKEFRQTSASVMEVHAKEIINWPLPKSRFAQSKRDEALYKLGQHFERGKSLNKALAIFELGQSGECRERTVRLAYGLDQKNKACAFLESMIADPATDDEYTFASEYYARKFNKKTTSLDTNLLRDASEIFADDIYRGSPELAMIDHYKRHQWNGFHTENRFWITLFALFFWDQLFETAINKTDQFDHYPVSLRHNKFAEHFGAAIQYTVHRLRSGEGLAIFRESIRRHNGKVNALFYWSRDVLTFIDQTLAVTPSNALATIIGKMALNYDNMSDGFPDLTLVRDKQLKFIEVKSEGDQIQRHQLTRIRQLKEAGFDVEICRVKYRVDPDQPFVVIDVETTGGSAQNGRVTEIGAVKVKGGKIIDQWQSLINPQRRIPSYITEITGISNDMVREAPVFSDVAGDLTNFMRGSVFAAHNVNFDYGFLSAEYQRLNQGFRYPKICTCASMRRYFPNHSSYSLAAMTREYGIPLKSHHRALCDTIAAAELLVLINERRVLKG